MWRKDFNFFTTNSLFSPKTICIMNFNLNTPIINKREGTQKLVFVYNADSGMANAFLDSLHKLFNPQTYQCNLCALTHNVFNESEVWKHFREHTDIEMQFLHRDEFRAQFENVNFELPFIFSYENGTINQVVEAKTIDSLKTVEDLIALVQEKFINQWVAVEI